MTDSLKKGATAAVEDYRLANTRTLPRIFIGEQGLRAGWSALLFVFIYLLLDTGVTWALGRFASLEANGPVPLWLALLQESGEVLVVFVATWIMARLENRPLLSYGYIGERRMTRLMSGAAWGALCLSVLVGTLWKAGLLVFEGLSLRGAAAWKYGFAWAGVFLLVGVFEESLLRGYLQYTLTRGIGFWWAALLLSAAFGFWHITNSGESALGLLVACAGGFVFCISLWYTKSLWWAVGFHAGWDWGQSYLYGTPNSGLVLEGHLLASHPAGNPLLSGGTTGPEGSAAILPLLVIMAAGMWIWWGRVAAKRPQISQSS